MALSVDCEHNLQLVFNEKKHSRISFLCNGSTLVFGRRFLLVLGIRKDVCSVKITIATSADFHQIFEGPVHSCLAGADGSKIS